MIELADSLPAPAGRATRATARPRWPRPTGDRRSLLAHRDTYRVLGFGHFPDGGHRRTERTRLQALRRRDRRSTGEPPRAAPAVKPPPPASWTRSAWPGRRARSEKCGRPARLVALSARRRPTPLRDRQSGTSHPHAAELAEQQIHAEPAGLPLQAVWCDLQPAGQFARRGVRPGWAFPGRYGLGLLPGALCQAQETVAWM